MSSLALLAFLASVASTLSSPLRRAISWLSVPSPRATFYMYTYLAFWAAKFGDVPDTLPTKQPLIESCRTFTHSHVLLNHKLILIYRPLECGRPSHPIDTAVSKLRIAQIPLGSTRHVYDVSCRTRHDDRVATSVSSRACSNVADVEEAVVLAVGGDLVQGWGDEVGALASKKYFFVPQNLKFGGTHCLREFQHFIHGFRVHTVDFVDFSFIYSLIHS